MSRYRYNSIFYKYHDIRFDTNIDYSTNALTCLNFLVCSYTKIITTNPTMSEANEMPQALVAL